MADLTIYPQELRAEREETSIDLSPRDPTQPIIIETVRGVGYRYREPASGGRRNEVQSR